MNSPASKKSEAEKNSGQRIQSAMYLRSIWARAYPRTIAQMREKSWVIFGLFMPVMSTAGFIFTYRGMGAPEEYIGFVVIGGAMVVFWTNVLWGMCAQLFWEKEQGNLPLMIMAPVPLSALLIGMATGGLLFSIFRAAVVVAVSVYFFDISFSVTSPLLLLLVFVLTMAALYGMGMMFSSLYLLLNREAWHLSHLMMEPVYLLGGFYFPVKHLGPTVAGAALLIPLTAGLDAARQLLFPSMDMGFLPVNVEIAILAVLSVVFLVSSQYLLVVIEKMAVKNGGLIESRR